MVMKLFGGFLGVFNRVEEGQENSSEEGQRKVKMSAKKTQRYAKFLITCVIKQL